MVGCYGVGSGVFWKLRNMGHLNAHSRFTRVIIIAWFGATPEEIELGKAAENIATNNQMWGDGMGPIL